jgi:archaellin
MSVAWPWLVGGVVAIGVGLAIWWTAFVLVPAGVALIAIGGAKWVRNRATAPHES